MFKGPLMLQVNWPFVDTILQKIKKICYRGEDQGHSWIKTLWQPWYGSYFISALLYHQPSEHQRFPPLCMGQVGYIALAWTQLKNTDGKSISPPVTKIQTWCCCNCKHVTFRGRMTPRTQNYIKSGQHHKTWTSTFFHLPDMLSLNTKGKYFLHFL